MADKYNTFWRRFFAGLLDAVVLTPIGLLIVFTQTNNVLSLIFGTVVMHSISYTYNVFFHWHSGQTYGKKWMNIRVVDKEESRLLTLEQSFKRDSIYILLETIGVMIISFQIVQLGRMPSDKALITQIIDWLATIWFLLELATMLTNEKRRALHDLLANSVVIKEEYWTGPERQADVS
jgi:uncharacterized RDD family membrane protein YckC